MNKKFITFISLCLYLLIFIRCSSNDIAGGSTDIEVSGVAGNSGGDDIGNAIVSLLPDSFSPKQTVDIPEEFLDTTNAKGEFLFVIPNTGTYTLYTIDTINHESYYQKSIIIDSSIDLGKVVTTKTANLFINIPTSFQEDSGYCIIPGTQRIAIFKPSQDTITFKDVPSGITFSIITYSFNDTISSKTIKIDSITPGDTDTTSGAIKVLYIIDTSTIKESYPVDLGDSLKVEGVIDITILTIENFQETDTAIYDIFYIASNVDFIDYTKKEYLIETNKPVICGSSEALQFIDMTGPTLDHHFGSDSLNSVTKLVNGWNQMFQDSTIGVNENFNLFSADTSLKYPVEWGLTSSSAKIAVEGTNSLLYNYYKGGILPTGFPTNGKRIGIFGCNVQQFNSQTIQMIRNVIIRFAG